ncbi:MAG: FAD-binding oxidoreductase [Parvularculaceae bacterium]|nr:FAD-binding oxidoreductase [Parvularculaceae bacterium]
MSTITTPASEDLIDRLRQIVGADHVRTDEATLALFSQDIYARAPQMAACVVAPAGTDELARVVAASTRSGRAVTPRGAGMSYSGGYLPTEAGSVMLDMRRMDRILDINADDMIVTAEVGCTWAALNAALKEKGLRTPFFGPLSGLVSTIGGGLAQNNAFFGAGRYGPLSESVTALRVVLADGTILDTGSAATRGGPPFFRHYGPDLTGLFLGDSGAFAIKAEAALRLIEAPQSEGYASFAFPSRDGALAAMSSISRAGLGAEVFGFDPNLQRVRMKRASLASDVGVLAGVVKRQNSLLAGVKEAAKVVVAGRDFVGEREYSVHMTAEGRSAAAVEADLEAARALARRAGGREIENTIPKVVRANPFAPLNNMIGPDVERWAPVHGILSHSRAAPAWAEIDRFFSEAEAEFRAHGVTTGCLFTSISTNAILIEPVFYWPSALGALHRESVEAWLLNKVTRFPPNPEADRTVARARRRIAEIFLAFGAAHFQVGKETYLYRESRSAAFLALLESIKSAVDPQRLVNPGSLGLQ